MPSSKDRLECCTEINETSTSQGRRDYIDDENEENNYKSCALSRNYSDTFNNTIIHCQRARKGAFK